MTCVIIIVMASGFLQVRYWFCRIFGVKNVPMGRGLTLSRDPFFSPHSESRSALSELCRNFIRSGHIALPNRSVGHLSFGHRSWETLDFRSEGIFLAINDWAVSELTKSPFWEVCSWAIYGKSKGPKMDQNAHFLGKLTNLTLSPMGVKHRRKHRHRA